MDKLSEVNEQTIIAIKEKLRIADTIQNLKEPFNVDLPLQICFGYYRPSSFDIQMPELVIIPRCGTKDNIEYYQQSRNFYLKYKQKELKDILQNIKKLKAKEKEIMDSLLETDIC